MFYARWFGPLGAALLGLVNAAAAQPHDVIENAARYTVKITTAIDYAFGNERKGTSRGSGFLVDRERGWILTNAHVVGKSPSSVRASFKDHPFIKVEKVYIDNQLDLAVIRIDPARIPGTARAASLNCAAEPRPGVAVVAFGHPWSLDYTATRGIVSGVKTLDGQESIQTDAALNPGNSGGPLIDAQSGSVVAVNAATLNKSLSEGLNFAVPIRHACVILDLLRAGKDPAPPLLPVTFATTSRERELVVAQSHGEWAESLKPGDRIVAVNGDDAALFASRFATHLRRGEAASVRILRDGRPETINLPAPRARDRVTRAGIHVSGMVIGGSTVTNFDPTVMMIHHVDEASVAEQSQFREGYQVLTIGGKTVHSQADILAALKPHDGKDVEIIVRNPRFSIISGRYDYFARTLDVRDVFAIDDGGARKDQAP